MLQSFLVYGLLALVLFLLGREISIKEAYANRHFNTEYKFLSWEMILMLLSFGFVVGVRWDVGVDHLSYLDGYKTIQKYGEFWGREDSIEIGFVLISKLFAFLNIHFSLYFAFWGIMQMLFLYLTFKNNKYLYPYIGLILILGPLFLSWNNGIRQTLATCIIMYGSQYIVDRKFLKYILWVFIATLIHKSAWIVLLFYFIPRDRVIINNRLLQLSILFVSIYLGFNQFWIDNLTRFGDIFSLLGYERFVDKIEVFINEDVDKNFGFRTISRLIIEFIVLLFSKKILSSYKDSRLVLFYNLFFIGICLYYLLYNTSHVFLRVLYYFDIVRLAFSALLLHYLLYKSKMYNLVKLPLFIIILLLAVSWTTVFVYEAGTGIDRAVLYKFFWDYI
ncbi:MAG: EpsG family protein [Bacteroidales bacterium]